MTTKKTTSWNRLDSLKDGSIMIATFLDDKTTMEFDLATLYPNYKEGNEAQRGCQFIGTKTRLANLYAKNTDERLTGKERKAVMQKCWDLLTVGGKYYAEGSERNTISKKKKEADAFVGDRDLKELTKEQLIEALRIVNIGS